MWTRFKRVWWCIPLVIVVLLRSTQTVMLDLVAGESMAPTYQNNEIIISSKFGIWTEGIERGDIVIARLGNELIIKRVIGLPGETIEISGGSTYINGEELDESYLDADRNQNGLSIDAITLGNDEYFLMGDNRDGSYDSRYFGTVKSSDIIRKVVETEQRFVISHQS